jgi:hypothetical protein
MTAVPVHQFPPAVNPFLLFLLPTHQMTGVSPLFSSTNRTSSRHQDDQAKERIFHDREKRRPFACLPEHGFPELDRRAHSMSDFALTSDEKTRSIDLSNACLPPTSLKLSSPAGAIPAPRNARITKCFSRNSATFSTSHARTRHNHPHRTLRPLRPQKPKTHRPNRSHHRNPQRSRPGVAIGRA